MSALFGTPITVMGLGIIISYGIAALIKLLLVAIRMFTNKSILNS